MLVPFATGILAAAICGFIALMVETGLPRLHHPLFEIPDFERASQDRFLLALEAPEAKKDVAALRKRLRRSRRHRGDGGGGMTRTLALLTLALLLSGCDVSMTQQKRYGTYAAGADFRRTAPRRDRRPSIRSRKAISRAMKPPRTRRRRRRNCSRAGASASTSIARPATGLPAMATASWSSAASRRRRPIRSKRLLEAPASHFYDVITNGYGAMYSYATRVEPRDRWAIVAYIRALQLQPPRRKAPERGKCHDAAISACVDRRGRRSAAAMIVVAFIDPRIAAAGWLIAFTYVGAFPLGAWRSS